MQGILFKYAKDVNSRTSLTLQKFNEKKYSSVEVETYMKTVDVRLEELGIICEELPDYSSIIEQQKWHIDVQELRRSLSQNINYGSKGNSFESDS